MKKLFLSLCLFFSACAAPQPQVTVTSEVTVTSTPSPAPSPQATETKEATATATATPTPEPTPTFEPMELSKEPSANVQCTMDDIQSGRYAAAEANLGITFPETVKNNGWESKAAIGKTESIKLKSGSFGAEQLASVCFMDGEVWGKPGKKLAILGIAVSNPDSSVRVLHVTMTVNGLEDLLNNFPKNKQLGINGWLSDSYIQEVLDYNASEFWYYEEIFERQGKDKMLSLVRELNRTGVVTSEMEKVIFLPSVANW